MVFPEDNVTKKLDKCLYDSLVKIGGGISIGTVASVLFLKRRPWPIITGFGFGLGYAYSNCEKDINQLFVVNRSS